MRLVVAAVQPPSFPRLDPANGRWPDALGQQPHTGIQRSLAGTDDHESLRPAPQARDVTDRYAVNAISHLERRKPDGGNAAFQVGGVDELSPHVHLVRYAGEVRDEPVPARGIGKVIAPREIAHAAAGDEMLLHHTRVISPQLIRTRQLVKTGVQAGLLHPVVLLRCESSHAALSTVSREHVHRSR